MTEKLLARFYEEEGLSDAAIGNDQQSQNRADIEFLLWAGIKVTPSNKKIARTLANKMMREDLINTAEGY